MPLPDDAPFAEDASGAPPPVEVFYPGKPCPNQRGLAGDVFELFPPTFRQHLLGHPYPADSAAFSRRETQLEADLAHAQRTPEQRGVLEELEANGISLVDAWHGSHVIFAQDGGALYGRWSHLAGATKRSSSHYPGVHHSQFELPFGNAALLFGLTPRGDTWCQMERHRLRLKGSTLHRLIGTQKHDLDYQRYRLSGQNVGPMGLSPHTEHSDPIFAPWEHAQGARDPR